MKHIEMLLATGANIQDAVKSMSDQLNKDYADKACQVQQIFLMPQIVPVSQIAATATGQPQMQMIVHLVAVVTEEPEVDALQRNFKPVFDFVNNHRDDLIPMAIGYLATIVGAISPELQAKYDSLKNKS